MDNTKISEVIPKWTNNISAIKSVFPQSETINIYTPEDSSYLVICHQPTRNVSELLRVNPQGAEDIIVESWLKESSGDYGTDMLTLQCLVASESQSDRADILNPYTAIKPIFYSWQNSSALNTQISIVSHSLWLSKWFAYKNFLDENKEVAIPKAIPENYNSEINLIINYENLVSVILERVKYRVLIWDVNLSRKNINHALGVEGYFTQVKLAKQFFGENPQQYAKLSQSDTLSIIYREDILKNI